MTICRIDASAAAGHLPLLLLQLMPEVPMITFEQALERFSYFSDTGEVIDRRTGDEAGKVEKNRHTSYRRFSFGNVTLRAHQVAWLLFYGAWPDGEIDHRDGDGLNNRISNLRCGTRTQNQRNQRLHVKNKTGVRGVSFHSPTKKWQALICVDGTRLFLGRFGTVDGAAAARKEAELKYWGE
jgi:hypothetical protein